MATIVTEAVPLGTTKSVKPPELNVQVTVTPRAGATLHAGAANASVALPPIPHANTAVTTANTLEIR
ncbi:unannotated protein [freshwater metagenome]|uniref:Unannotated protein n=1 Tax=freshwater metagenome TaxID=449393 RepID=A0A6J7HVZ4_9ZZZZ